jgi:hypothetical protein
MINLSSPAVRDRLEGMPAMPSITIGLLPPYAIRTLATPHLRNAPRGMGKWNYLYLDDLSLILGD